MRMKGHSQRQNGQALVLIAIILPVLLGMAALAVDTAHLFVEKRHIQNTADAAALAAAAKLLPYPKTCGGPYTASGTCQYDVSQAIYQYSTVYNDGPNVTYAPCVSASDTNCFVTTDATRRRNARVQVRISESAPTWFIGALGFGGPVSVSSSARATPLTQIIPGTTTTSTLINPSTSTTTITTFANDNTLFAMNSMCGPDNGIVIASNDQKIDGPVTSNGSVNINGNNAHLAYVNYRETAAGNCSAGAGVNSSTVDTITTHTNTLQAPQDWPASFDDTTICNNYMDSGAPLNVHIVSGDYKVPSNANGVYCNSDLSTGTITDNNNNATLSYTLVAHQINFTGNDEHVTPYTGSLLAYMTGDGTLSYTANNLTLSGYLFVPNGDITVAGNGGTNGFYEAKNIRINGNGSGGTTVSTSISYPTTTVTSTTPPTTSITGVALDR
jgi:Flp pilus assembly protein TadG